MSISIHENELQLGKFGEYLLKTRMVPEQRAPFFVRWVRKFISQVPASGICPRIGANTGSKTFYTKVAKVGRVALTTPCRSIEHEIPLSAHGAWYTGL